MAHRSFRSPRALPCGEHRVDGCEVGRGSAVLRGRLAVGLCDQRTWASPQCIAGHTCCPLGPTVGGKFAILLPNNPIPNETLVSILLSRSRNPSRLVDLGGGFVSRDWKGVCPQHEGVPIITSTVGQTGGSGREFKCPPRRSTSSHEEWGGAGVAALLMHDRRAGLVAARRAGTATRLVARRSPALSQLHVPHASIRTVCPGAQTDRPARTLPYTSTTAQLRRALLARMSLVLLADNGIRRRRRRRRRRHRRRRCCHHCRRHRRGGGGRRGASQPLCAGRCRRGCRTPLLDQTIPRFPALCFPPCRAAVLGLTIVAPHPLYRDHVSPRTGVSQLGAAHGWARTTRLSVAHATSTSRSHPQPLATAMEGR